MHQTKIVVLGITGDLAKLKILPSVAQLAELNQTKTVVELLGYSRSIIDKETIENILNKNTKSRDKHYLTDIKLENGDYEDPAFFSNLVSSLKEGQKAIVYLAIPPSKFLKILQNSCPYNQAEKIDIIVEKPFGQNIDEAKAMIDVINACQMGYKVHFCDHYLFKNATRIPDIDIKNFSSNLSKDIKSLKIQALESIGVNDRVGYYDNAGALMDMLPHLYSLMIKTLQLVKPGFNGGQLKFDFMNAKFGQYLGYLSDTGLEQSSTETYFNIKTSVSGFQGENFDLHLESGKLRPEKQTTITLEFKDGSKLLWEISPMQKLSYVYTDQELSINLDRGGVLDHTNLFQDILNENYKYFVTPNQVIWGWELYQTMLGFVKKNNLEMIKYTKLQDL